MNEREFIEHAITSQLLDVLNSMPVERVRRSVDACPGTAIDRLAELA